MPMSDVERDYFTRDKWTLDRDTFEWYHKATGLTTHDLWLLIEHYNVEVSEIF